MIYADVFKSNERKELQAKINSYCLLYLPTCLSLLMFFILFCECKLLSSNWSIPSFQPAAKKMSQFLLIVNVLISCSFLKDCFADYRILDWQSFPFNVLNMSSTPLWPPCFWSEISFIPLEDLHDYLPLSCCFQDGFFVFG